MFSYGQGMGSNSYMNWEKLYNTEKNGYMQLLAPIEENVFQRTQSLLKTWRESGSIDIKSMQSFYNVMDDFISTKYAELFEL